LFDRSGRTTRLTDAGEVYLRYAKRAAQELQEAKRAIDDLGDLSRGSLRVGVTPTFTSYLVGPLVAAFHSRYPNITLVVREIAQEAMEELLLADEVDVGIAFDNGHHLDLEAQALLVETLALVVGKHHPLATTGSIGLEALNSESLILLSAEFATREQIDSYCRQHDIRPHVQVEANTISALIEVVSRTTLSTLLPATIALAHEQLVAIELDQQRLQRTAVLMQRKGVYQTAAARAFVELAMKVAKQLEAPGCSAQLM